MTLIVGSVTIDPVTLTETSTPLSVGKAIFAEVKAATYDNSGSQEAKYQLLSSIAKLSVAIAKGVVDEIKAHAEVSVTVNVSVPATGIASPPGTAGGPCVGTANGTGTGTGTVS